MKPETVDAANQSIEAKQIDLPDEIVTFLQRRGITIASTIKSRYWVSEIVGCQRKTYYRQLGIEQEELLSDMTMEGMWNRVRGDLLHKLTYAYRWRELDFERYVPLRNGRTAVVVGRADAYSPKTKTIIDLKTTKYMQWQMKNGFIPRPEDILQLQCYDTIFSQLMPIEELNVVYADMSNIVAYRVHKRNLSDWIDRRVQAIEDSLFEDRIPNGDVSGLCQYCKYQTRCYNDGNGLIEKPLSIPRTSSG